MKHRDLKRVFTRSWRSVVIASTALLVLLAGTTGPAAASQRPAATPVAAAPAASSAIEGKCDQMKSSVWVGATLLVSFLPGFTLFSGLGAATYMSYFAYYNRCVFPKGGAPVLTVAMMMDEFEKIADERIDTALRASIERRIEDLISIVEREKTNLENFDQLNSNERTHLASVMQALGNDASQVEAELIGSQWQTLPAVGAIAGVKNGAYVLAHELSEEGAYKKYLRETLIPEERQESLELIAPMEAQFAREVVNDLELRRYDKVNNNAGCSICAQDEYIVKAHAKHGDEFLYFKDWECEDKWIKPGNPCSNWTSNRSQYFNAARTAMEEKRGDLASVLEPEYLGVKNALNMYRGTSFTLVNNMVEQGTRKCLDVPNGGGVGAFVRLGHCDPGAHDEVWPATSDQLWRFRRGTSQVQNVKTGLCLDPQGYPSEDVPGAVVQLGECSADENDPDHAGQRWGMHPLGYLVNLSSGKCLDLQGEGATAAGTTAQMWECEYELGSNGPGRSGGKGGDLGLKPGDQVTDQVWTPRYRGTQLKGLPKPPPADLDTALPVAADDHLIVAKGSGTTKVWPLRNDEDPDGGPMWVESLTQPGHGVAEVAGDGDQITYRPDAEYCNEHPAEESGARPDDEFTYTLNGGSTATVSVTVECPDAPPVAVDDAITVDQDSDPTAIDVLANDTDPDGGEMQVESVTDPDHGTATITGDGTGVEYAPAAGYCNGDGDGEVEEFAYTLNGGSSATVSVTVACPDAPPVAVGDAFTVEQDSGPNSIDVLANDTDPDGGPMRVEAVTDPAHGTATINEHRTAVIYEPDEGHCDDSAADEFTYSLNGGASAPIAVTVACTPEPVGGLLGGLLGALTGLQGLLGGLFG